MPSASGAGSDAEPALGRAFRLQGIAKISTSLSMPRRLAFCACGVRSSAGEDARSAHPAPRRRCEDGLRRREVLDARGDVDGLPEIVLPVVHRDGRCRGLHACRSSEQQILATGLGVEVVHCLSHAERRGDRPVRARECRHHGVADRLDHCPCLACHDLIERAENAHEPCRRPPGPPPSRRARSTPSDR